MTEVNKNSEKNKTEKRRLLRDLDLLMRIRHQELKVWCLANNLSEKLKKKCVCLNLNI